MASTEHRPDRPRLIATKFRAPARSGPLLVREHLLKRLDARRDRQLTLIHGPAGFGKTTLAVQWRERLQADGAAVAWLSLSRDDNAIDRFLAYLVEAICTGEPSVQLDVASLLEAKVEQAYRIVLADLVNELEALTRDVHLVLDDWHLITDRAVRDAVTFLLEHAPPTFHIVLTSRERPTLPLARLRVDDQLTEITSSDLRFSVGESRAFLCDVNELRLDEGSVRSLWTSTEGWVAALQLALLSLRSTGATAHAIEVFSGKQHAIGEYLTENVLDHLPAELLEFLLSTSILDRLSGSLCAAVSGRPDSQQMLESLDKQDLFILPLDESREWYRYHHLFANHLQRRLKRSAPQRALELHRAASQWFADHGHTDEAVTHALAAGDPQRAVELVERDAMWLVEHSYMASLRNLVSKLPAQRLLDRAALQVSIAWGHCLSHRPAEARVALAHAQKDLVNQAGSSWDEVVVEARVVEAAVRIYQDRTDGVEQLLRPCFERSSAFRPWVVAVAANVRTYVHLRCFEHDEALALQAWARPFQDRAQGPFSAIYGRCFAGIAAQASGQAGTAVQHFQEALRMADASIGRHSHAARLAEALLGQLMVEMNELDDAERLLDDSRALGVEGGVADFSIATYVSSSRLLAQRGDHAGAHAVLDEGMKTAEHLQFSRLATAVVCERVRLRLAVGDVNAAARLLDAETLQVTGGIEDLSQADDLRLVALARLRRAQGRASEAIALMSHWLEPISVRKRPASAARLRIQLALAHDAAGDTRSACSVLSEALALGLAAGLRRSFLDDGPRLVAMIRQLQDKRRGDIDATWAAVQGPLTQLLEMAEDSAQVSPCAAVTAPVRHAGTAAPAVELLKEREVEILQLLENGRSNKEIARILSIGIDTVKWYLKSIYGKLGVSSRAKAVHAARRTGTLD
jgi:ATP/maltotriose-dependent transcriptional regulator MalT